MVDLLFAGKPLKTRFETVFSFFYCFQKLIKNFRARREICRYQPAVLIPCSLSSSVFFLKCVFFLVQLLLLLQALVVAHPGLIWVFADANQQSFQLSRVVDEGLSAKVPARYCPAYRVSSGAGCHDVVDCLRISARVAIWCPLMTEFCLGGSVYRRVSAHALVPDNLVSSVV